MIYIVLVHLSAF